MIVFYGGIRYKVRYQQLKSVTYTQRGKKNIFYACRFCSFKDEALNSPPKAYAPLKAAVAAEARTAPK